MPSRRVFDDRLVDIVGDRQVAWWLVVSTAVYALLSMSVIPPSLAVMILAALVVVAVYISSYSGMEPLEPAHLLLFPGLHPRSLRGSAECDKTSEWEDSRRRSEVTPRNVLESASRAKMSPGSSGTTKASLKEDAPLATPVKLTLPTLSGENCRCRVGGMADGGVGNGSSQAEGDGPGSRPIPAALPRRGDEGMWFSVKGTFLHVECSREANELLDDDHPAASREGSIEASVLSASEEGSVTGAVDSSDSREAMVAAAAGRRRFRRRRSISDADLTYTAYLAELAMERKEGVSVECGMLDEFRGDFTLSSGDSSVEVSVRGAPTSTGRDGQDRLGLNPDAPEFVPQYLSGSWLSMSAPPPGIGHQRTDGFWESRRFR